MHLKNISINAGKAFDNMIDQICDMRKRKNFLNLTNAISKKFNANIILNGKMCIPFNTKGRQVCPLSLLLFSTALEAIASKI